MTQIIHDEHSPSVSPKATFEKVLKRFESGWGIVNIEDILSARDKVMKKFEKEIDTKIRRVSKRTSHKCEDEYCEIKEEAQAYINGLEQAKEICKRNFGGE